MFGLSALPTDSFYKFTMFAGILLLSLTLYLSWSTKSEQRKDTSSIDSIAVVKKYDGLRLERLKQLEKNEKNPLIKDSLTNVHEFLSQKISLATIKIKQLQGNVDFIDRFMVPAFAFLFCGLTFFALGAKTWLKIQQKNDEILEVQRKNTILDNQKLQLEVDFLKRKADE